MTTTLEKFRGAVEGTANGYNVMECPWCKGYLEEGQTYDKTKQEWKFDRWVTPIRARYICGTCDKGVQYEM